MGLLPLCSSVALALYSDHVDPQQAVQWFESHACHLGVFILHPDKDLLCFTRSRCTISHTYILEKCFTGLTLSQKDIPRQVFLTYCTLIYSMHYIHCFLSIYSVMRNQTEVLMSPRQSPCSQPCGVSLEAIHTEGWFNSWRGIRYC